MSDMDLNTRNENSSQSQNTGSSQNLKDQMADAGAEIKQRAGDVLRASTDTRGWRTATGPIPVITSRSGR